MLTVAVKTTSLSLQVGFEPAVWAMEMVGMMGVPAAALQVCQQTGGSVMAWVRFKNRLVNPLVVIVQGLPGVRLSEPAQLS